MERIYLTHSILEWAAMLGLKSQFPRTAQTLGKPAESATALTSGQGLITDTEIVPPGRNQSEVYKYPTP